MGFFSPGREKVWGGPSYLCAETGYGSIVSSPGDLCETFQSFYTSLFSAEPVDTAAQDDFIFGMPAMIS